MEVTGDPFIVNTGQVIQGPPIGTNTTGQEAEGPHCIGAGDGDPESSRRSVRTIGARATKNAHRRNRSCPR